MKIENFLNWFNLFWEWKGLQAKYWALVYSTLSLAYHEQYLVLWLIKLNCSRLDIGHYCDFQVYSTKLCVPLQPRCFAELSLIRPNLISPCFGYVVGVTFRPSRRNTCNLYATPNWRVIAGYLNFKFFDLSRASFKKKFSIIIKLIHLLSVRKTSSTSSRTVSLKYGRNLKGCKYKENMSYRKSC